MSEQLEKHARLKELDDLIERQQQLHKLESSVVKVSELTVEFARMVDEHGETIDSIEADVNETKDDFKQVRDQIRKGVEYRKSASRKKLRLIICIGMVVTILVLALILYLIWTL